MNVRTRECDLSHIDPAAYELQAAPGCVVVEMAPRSEEIGGIYLPDRIKTAIRPDIGRVVAVGKPWKGTVAGYKLVSDPSDVPIGADVIVNRRKGFCVAGFGWDERVARSETRFYGITGRHGLSLRYRYDEAILAIMDTHGLKAVGRGVILRVRDREKGLIETLNDPIDVVADVVSAGRDSGYEAGQEVVVNPSSLYFMGDEFKDLAHCYGDSIYGVRS